MNTQMFSSAKMTAASASSSSPELSFAGWSFGKLREIYLQKGYYSLAVRLPRAKKLKLDTDQPVISAEWIFLSFCLSQGHPLLSAARPSAWLLLSSDAGRSSWLSAVSSRLRLFTLQDPTSQQLMGTLVREIHRSKKIKSQYIEALALAICLREMAQMQPQAPVASDTHAPLTPFKLQQIKDHIEAHLDQKLELEELSQIANMSPSYFSRAFKAMTGRSPFQYIQDERMQRARRLITETKQAINLICLEVGFDNPAHFTNSFKKYFGVSPKTYRKNT